MSKLGAVDALAAAVKTHVAVLGMTGMGKSWLVRGELERELDASGQVLVLDPTGVHYGIRLKADGKTPSQYKVVVIGGDHGDLPLNPDQGEKLARTLGTSSTSAVIDMRGLSVKHSIKFFTDFAETLLGANRGARRLVIDEAHRFMPQSGGRIDPQRGQMLHAANELVSGGRSAGLGVMMLSQRPAKVHKDSLTQCQALVALGVFHNLDRKAIETWVAGQSDKARGEELVASLAELPVGTGWVWAPRFGVFEKVQFPKIKTFDSMKPLAAGESPAALPQIDVEALRLALAPPTRPAPVKREISVPSNEAAKINTPSPKEQRALETARAREIEAAEQRGFEQGWRLGQEGGFSRGWDAYARSLKAQVAAIVEGPPAPLPPAPKRPKAVGTAPFKAHAIPHDEGSVGRPAAFPSAHSYRSTSHATADPDNRKIGAERRPLKALAAIYPAGYTDGQWRLAAGFKDSGTWSEYRRRLKASEFIQESDGQWFATEAGVAAVGNSIPIMPSPGMELAKWWAERISGARRMMLFLAERYPASFTKFELGEALGMSHESGTFSEYLRRLRSPGLIEQDGNTYRASPAVMGDA